MGILTFAAYAFAAYAVGKAVLDWYADRNAPEEDYSLFRKNPDAAIETLMAEMETKKQP